jgi:hypothetical protein
MFSAAESSDGSTADHVRSEFVVDALQMAIWRCSDRRTPPWRTRTTSRPAIRKMNRQKAVRIYRGQIPSPGAATIALREDRVRFWAAIVRGLKTEDAGVEAEVSSPVVVTR